MISLGDKKIKVVIMAGGQGSRLWPLSRASHPKQFLSLLEKETMLQKTVSRLKGLAIESILTICNEEHRFFVADQLKDIDCESNIILEPEGKNTAPAIALSAFLSRPSDLLLVLSADHVIKNDEEFKKSILQAVNFASKEKLVTFGIVPNKITSDYGYIKKGKNTDTGFEVDEFVEKPPIDKAAEYIASGEYLWNSGMFMFTAQTYLRELESYNPEIFKACKLAVQDSSNDSGYVKIDSIEFSKCPSKSIDHSVMEKTKDSIVLPVDIDWNDIGSWPALWEASEQDAKGNVVQGDIKLKNSKNSYVSSENKLVVAIGIDDLIVVSTKDALLVSSKKNVQEIKEVVEDLKQENRNEWENHREVHRPWGKYDSVDYGNKHQVKRITVNPGEKLSVQKHLHRAEHWIVVTGKARVTNGDKTFMLKENESTYIPVGEVHSLENPTDELLEIIEVQTGSYLGEDDIVRYEDIYGRIKK